MLHFVFALLHCCDNFVSVSYTHLVTLSDCIIDRCSRAVGIWVRDGGTVEDIHIHHLTGSTLRLSLIHI